MEDSGSAAANLCVTRNRAACPSRCDDGIAGLRLHLDGIVLGYSVCVRKRLTPGRGRGAHQPIWRLPSAVEPRANWGCQL